MVKAQIKKWGNSLALLIPESVAQELALNVDSRVGLTWEDGVLTIRPHRRRPNLSDLLQLVSKANRHGEVFTGAAHGEEAW